MAASLEEIRSHRIKKLETLHKNGINPYPSTVSFDVLAADQIKKNFKKYTNAKKNIGVAGRLTGKREHGGSMFLDIFDGTDKIQVFLGKDKIGEKSYDLFSQTIDVGDFIAVLGKAFYTKRKEPTIKASKWEILAKSLLPLPEKWHGLQDVEERYRKRYLDLLMNEEVRRTAILRGKIISSMRAFLDKEGFLEVETPILQTLPGGASARPFKTHHNALGVDLYLRIAPELYLKQLLIGGFNKIYELGRSFRNEGMDASHNPEFTTVEFYAAYFNEENLIKLLEKMFVNLAGIFSKNKTIVFDGQKISFKAPFKRIKFLDALERHALIMDYHKKTRDELATSALRFGLKPENYESKDKIAEKIFAKVCRNKFTEPIFVTDYPVGLLPLAKRLSVNNNTALAFQLFAGGLELIKAFSELNDPLDQKARFSKEEEAAKLGDIETQPMDKDFIEALEYGMPPAAGAGIGIDRLVRLFADTANIKEVILFPTMKPKL